MNNDTIYEMVTERIVQEMEKGIIPWQRPWTDGQVAISHTTGRPYSLLNQFLLGYKPGEYLTFNQCKAEGGNIRPGEKSSIVVFWQTSYLKKEVDEDEEGNETERKVRVQRWCPILKYYRVFHIEQCDGIKPRYGEMTKTVHHDPIAEAEDIIGLYFNRETCTLNVCSSNEAFYSPTTDSVTVPLLSQYEVKEEYYSTLFHEMIHSTGHSSRLDRLSKTAAFGSEDYSREELTAEMGSAFLRNKIGIDCTKAFTNSVAYLQGWLKALKEDKKMIVVAAGKAEAAVNYIFNGKQETNPALQPVIQTTSRGNREQQLSFNW